MTFDQEFLDSVWQALSSGQDVIVFLPVVHEDLLVASRPIFDFLRPCGFNQELDYEAELANETWLIVKHRTHFLTEPVLNHLRTRATVFVL